MIIVVKQQWLKKSPLPIMAGNGVRIQDAELQKFDTFLDVQKPDFSEVCTR